VVTFTCRCCGHSQTFFSEQEAFDAGWDTPEWFGFLAPLCDLCPTLAWAKWITIDGEKYLREPFPGEPVAHQEAHEHWEEHGRPDYSTLPESG